MQKEEINNCIRILSEVTNAAGREDVSWLRELSNQTIHTASIESDTDSINLAVVIYSLSKMIERKKYSHYEEWPSFLESYKRAISKALLALESSNIEGFRSSINNIRKDIRKFSPAFKTYIQDVFRKAQINKASKIYEHGISMERTAELLGITIWELSEYTGQSSISDTNLSVTMPIKKRLKIAERIFKNE